ncbi:MAG: hypothetical protein KAW12_21110 [Candidatus Aminicenantes bacterium]|nr:hypothetical protein [Candidatus Aminicenantes bacterium]
MKLNSLFLYAILIEMIITVDTKNIKDSRNAELKGFGFKIITSAEFCKLWESKNE